MGKKRHAGHVSAETTLGRTLNTFVYHLSRPHKDLVAGIIEAKDVPEDAEECAQLILSTLKHQGVSPQDLAPLYSALVQYRNDLEHRRELMRPKQAHEEPQANPRNTRRRR